MEYIDDFGLDYYTKRILYRAKDQKIKSGKFKMRLENRDALDNFMMFDPSNDWMEAKEFTKLCKLLAAAVLTGSDLIGEPIGTWHNSIVTETASAATKDYRKTYSHRYGVSLYSDIRLCTLERQYSLRQEYDDPEDKRMIQILKQRVELLQPVVEKAKAMEKRLTRNGKFPKEEAERRRREVIKGKMDKKLLDALTEVRAEWVKIIFQHELEWRNGLSAGLVADSVNVLQRWNETEVPRDEVPRKMLLLSADVIKWQKVSEKVTHLVACSLEELEKSAQLAADHEGDDFLFKMADKFGGLVTGKREFLSVEPELRSSRTTLSSVLVFRFAGDSMIRIENKIITNRSVHNKYFYQYPCNFSDVIVDGVRIKSPSEFTAKKAFMD